MWLVLIPTVSPHTPRGDLSYHQHPHPITPRCDLSYHQQSHPIHRGVTCCHTTVNLTWHFTNIHILPRPLFSCHIFAIYPLQESLIEQGESCIKWDPMWNLSHLDISCHSAGVWCHAVLYQLVILHVVLIYIQHCIHIWAYKDKRPLQLMSVSGVFHSTISVIRHLSLVFSQPFLHIICTSESCEKNVVYIEKIWGFF